MAAPLGVRHSEIGRSAIPGENDGCDVAVNGVMRGLLLTVLMSIATPAAAQDVDATVQAQLWESCLLGGAPSSVELACTAALALPDLSEHDTAAVLAQRGNAHAVMGQWDRAVPDLARALELNHEEPTALLARSIGLLDRGDPVRVIVDLTAFLRWLPGHAGALNARAIANVRAGRPVAAVADFTEALRLSPNHPLLLHNRGNALRDLGRTEAAIRDYNLAVQSGGASARLLSDRCLARLSRGDLLLAEVDCDAAATMAPDEPGLIENADIVALKQNRQEKALAAFGGALAIRPNLPWSLYGRGVLRIRRGDVPSGLADIREAQSLAPRVSDDFERFGIRP